MTSIDYYEFQAGQGVSAPALNQNFTLTNNAIEALELSLNSNVTDISSLVNSKAAKNGSSSETFNVANATNVSQAVNLGQLKFYVPAGSVIFYAGYTVPNGYLLCDGRTVSKEVYPELFSAIGTLYGGNGNPYFNLPVLTDNRFIRGVSLTQGISGYQNSNIAAHAHNVSYVGAVSKTNKILNLEDTTSNYATASTMSATTEASGSGNETYPKNLGLLPCIKY